MLFNYPSFINTKEQTPSELLFNSIRMLVQTHTTEIWYDLDFGTNIRNLIKQGIDNITITEIQEELEQKLNTYFENDILINSLQARQELDKIKIDLDYTELRTGKHYTVQTEETITNPDQTLY
nr:hypothetical protein DGKKSRWO_DGKKSRWO_CDS_0016 [uncultured phage]CAI9752128.1 hypothetical protein CVNMHQAP_CVNMHQAP_CDS_0016 [uncultured phage]